INEFNEYLRELKLDDPLAYSVLDVNLALYRNMFSEAIRKARGLIKRVVDKPEVAKFVFSSLGRAYRFIGEIDTSDRYLIQAAEIAEFLGDHDYAYNERLEIMVNKCLKAEYEPAYKEIRSLLREHTSSPSRYYGMYILASLEVVLGRTDRTMENLDRLISNPDFIHRLRLGASEMKGLLTRLLGRVEKAQKIFIETAKSFMEIKSAYVCFPLAKALEISRLTSLALSPRQFIRESIKLSRKGSPGEIAAADEVEALLVVDEKEASERLFEAAQGYHIVYQNMEAFWSGLTAAYIAWKSDSPLFTKIIKFLSPLAPLHPGFKKDPLLGKFLAQVEPLMSSQTCGSEAKGIRANLIGGLRLTVDGTEISTMGWGRGGAVSCLVYLLLSPRHRIPGDHLFYLLWPNKKYSPGTRRWLYNLITTIRKNLGRPNILIKRGDFYQLEDVWTDLGEIENLLRLADATHDLAEKEEYLSRARDLAKGELLPEFPYDPYIDEYRQYYKQLRKRIFGQ
ncbi:MAG: hypothetical protein ABIM46_09140, partial [candidate division WOR-3 bacterium]